MRARIKLALGIAVLVVLGWLAIRDPEAPAQVKSANASVKAKSRPSYPLRARRIDRETRASMVEALGKLRDATREIDQEPERVGLTTRSDLTPMPKLPDRDARDERRYIRAAIKEIVPLLATCYERGLERDPELAGTVVVEFTIEGEAAVGGLIGDSTISDESTIHDAKVRECIQETMFAIRIDPPVGGEIHVRYPFTFRPAR